MSELVRLTDVTKVYQGGIILDDMMSVKGTDFPPHI